MHLLYFILFYFFTYLLTCLYIRVVHSLAGKNNYSHFLQYPYSYFYLYFIVYQGTDAVRVSSLEPDSVFTKFMCVMKRYLSLAYSVSSGYLVACSIFLPRGVWNLVKITKWGVGEGGLGGITTVL